MSKKSKILRFLLTLLLIVSVCSTTYFGYHFYEEQREIQRGEEVDHKIAETDLKNLSNAPDLERVKQTAPDAKMWLKFPDADIDTVVVQGEDNEFYLKYLPDKTAAPMGSVFLDKRNDPKITNNYLSYIYGHNALNHVRFQGLDKIFDSDKETYFYIYQDGNRYTYKVVYKIQVNPYNDLYPSEDTPIKNAEMLKSALKSSAGLSDADVSSVKDGTSYVSLVTCKSYTDSSKRKLVIGELIDTTKTS